VGVFDLTSNPFAILRVSPRDDRDAILAAYEDAVTEGRPDERKLLEAQHALMASKPRLHAELSWLLDVAPARVNSILNSLQKATGTAEAATLLEELPGLARANLAADLCGRLEPAEPRAQPAVDGGAHLPLDPLDELVVAQADIDPPLVLKAVNTARVLAGFPQLDLALVQEGLKAIREQHRNAALELIFATSHPGKRMTQIVDEFLHEDNYIFGFVEDLVERFDARCSERFRVIEDSIRAAETRLRENPHEQWPLLRPPPKDSASGQITQRLAEWDEYSQPRQLVYQAKGLDESRSRILYKSLRDLCVWLANEEHAYQPARQITQALSEAFSELPSVASQSAKDLPALGELLAQEGLAEAMRPLITAIEEVHERPMRIGGSALRHLKPDGHGLAGRLYMAFEESVRRTRGSQSEEAPWLAIRNLAIEINNEMEMPHVALALLEMTEQCRTGVPPAETARQLREDLETVRRNLLSKALREGDLRRSQELSERLAAVTENPDTRAQITATRDAIRRQITSRRWKWLGGGAVGLFVIWVLVEDPGGQDRPAMPSAPTSWSDRRAVTNRGVDERLEAKSPAGGSSGSISSARVLLNPNYFYGAFMIQRRLQELGHYRMALDGDWGPGSQAALKSFKRSQGLPPNQQWDAETQRRLFAGTGR